jgi:GPH family glycoside/pentoside/hexuronide:cation symporter
MTQRDSIRRPTLLLYALPAFALAMPTIPAYVYLPTFYAETLGLGLAAVGAVLLIARVLDVVTDPLIGIASDRLPTRWGRRKPWIIAGALIAAVALVQLFQPPADVGPTHLLVWSIALYLGWTLVAVPYTAWGAELSPDYHERARITGAREAAMVLGVVAAGGLPSLIAYLGYEQTTGLAAVAWLAIAAGAPAILLLVWRVKDGAGSGETARSAQPPPRLIRQSLSALLANRPFVRLLAGWFVNGLANGLPAVLFPLYLQHALGAGTAASGVLIMAYFVAGVVAIPAWLALSRRFGKHRVWCWAMIMACLAFVWVPFLEPGQIAAFFAICIVTGMALGADLALPPAMQADVIDLDTLRTGQQRAGLFFALWSMSTKLALALAVGLAFPALDALGFAAGGENDRETILWLAVIYAWVPTVLKLCAIAMIWSHPMSAKRHDIVRRRLDALAKRSPSGPA